ncbi:hypothetical protein HC341_03775 [Aquisalimonas sp. 2447]|uniref:hypothetical protein n=1 Tax=Aquisalimonas sp. 2447 TaxID=2740807 RepID=UPI00143249F7|nr:hypothetical protein [Aquisalimonas sp. 2447]QIT54412.1 hypothetical protein HC341_03775 [Aquisalimonas sp. 2447]
MIPVEIVGSRSRRVRHVSSPRAAFRLAQRQLQQSGCVECRFRNGGFVTYVTAQGYCTRRDPLIGVGQ